ncbi:MAG: mechanosensitive ion channel family protein [Saprospiraceae bacterium]|nr:mechanosensitive ion channel family protein [Saprospiraceae bacterium]
MEKYIDLLTSMFVAYAPKVLLALLTLVIGLQLIGWFTRLVDKSMAARSFDANVKPFLRSLVNAGLKIMLLLSIAGMFGIETTSFIAIFSALAFAIGLALQGSIGHFASGVLLLIFKPYKVGELVSIGGGQTGNVEEIGVFNTVLRTPDNKKIIIPNGLVTSNIITNISGQGEIRVDMAFGVGTRNSIDTVRATIQQVADNCPMVLKSKPVDILVTELNPDRYVFAVRPWCDSAHYWDTYFYMHEHIKIAFDREGIAAPANVVVVQQH